MALTNKGWVVAFDQALGNTGVAITNGKIIYTTVLVTKSKLGLDNRLHQIDKFVTKVIETIFPEEIVLEVVFPGRFRNAAMRLAQVYCTITNACFRYEIPYTVMDSAIKTSDSWPARLGIKGTKEHCKDWLLTIHPDKETINKLAEHEYDAIGILWAKMVEDKAISVESIANLPIIKLVPNDLFNYSGIKCNRRV
jgi:Holliday junction resolvasome RuvABC endonuclease subunit